MQYIGDRVSIQYYWTDNWVGLSLSSSTKVVQIVFSGQEVFCLNYAAKRTNMRCGVPLGSVLSTLFFNSWLDHWPNYCWLTSTIIIMQTTPKFTLLCHQTTTEPDILSSATLLLHLKYLLYVLCFCRCNGLNWFKKKKKTKQSDTNTWR